MQSYRLAAAGLACAACLLLGATPAPGGVNVTVQTVRDSVDLLDSVAIEVVAHNASSSLRSVRFAQPAEYAIDVLSGSQVIWTSLPPSPAPGATVPVHSRSFATGPTPMVLYEWNALASGRWSPLPGAYTVRVTLLDDARPTASVGITFARPLPTTALEKLKPGEEVTLGGRLDALRGTLSDANGSVRLTRRLLPAPPDFPVVLRGSATDHPDGSRTFTVDRWAPLGGPPPMPTPAATPP